MQNTVGYLRVLIDRALKWNLQIENVIKKLASAARSLCKIRHYVDRQTLIDLYYTFAYPHLKYGVLAWGNADKVLMQKITVMQNRIIRIINFKLLKDHDKMSVLYKAMNILQALDIFKLEVGKFMHSFLYQTLSEQWRRHGGTRGDDRPPNDFLIIFPNRLEPQSLFFQGVGEG